MNRKGSALVLFLGGLALIFAALAGYFYLQTRQEPGSLQVETGDNRQEQVDEMVNPDSIGTNWKTYSNNTYGIFFKYPPSLTEYGGISGPASGDARVVLILGDKTTGFPNTDIAFDGFAIYVDQNESNLTFERYMDRERLAQQRPGAMGDPNSKCKESETTISQEQGVILQGCPYDNIYRLYSILADGKTIISISKLSTNERFNETFDQILSTFKFID